MEESASKRAKRAHAHAQDPERRADALPGASQSTHAASAGVGTAWDGDGNDACCPAPGVVIPGATETTASVSRQSSTEAIDRWQHQVGKPADGAPTALTMRANVA